MPYIYSFSDKYIAGFLSVAFSGDGNVVVGTNDQRNYWVWRKGIGTSPLLPLPDGYQVASVSTSFDGSVVAGILSVPWPNNQGTASKLFRWTAGTGVTVLPDILASDTILSVLASDDGKFISFVCESADGKPCKGAPFPSGGEHQAVKIWTTYHGYQNIGPDFDKYGFVEQSPDLKRFLVNGSYMYSKNIDRQRVGMFYHEAPTMVMDENGKVTPFREPYSDFKLDHVYNNTRLSMLLYKPYVHNSGFNTLVYDSSGSLVTTKLPNGCLSFEVTVIDGRNNIFGECFNPMSRPIGLRISESHTETINKWLRDNGLNYDFPLNTAIFKVSDNGQTVQGFVDPGVGTCGCSTRVLYKPPATTGPPGSQYGFDPTEVFIAHIN